MTTVPVKDKIGYTVSLVSDFAKKNSLTTIQAFNYFDRFNAIGFVNQHYNITHTISFTEILGDLSLYCKNHGVGLVILYHGSTVEIKEIDLSLSKPNKNFGKGFYLSDNFVQAYELASLRKICIALGCEIGGVMEVNSVEGER